METFLASPEPFPRSRGALVWLLRDAGFRGNPSRFPGAVSSVPGGVEAAFERCRLPRNPFSLPRSRFLGPGGVEAAFESCRLPLGIIYTSILFILISSVAPGGVEAAFEGCRLPRETFSLLLSSHLSRSFLLSSLFIFSPHFSLAWDGAG